jgi:nicotinamidase-related amidase
MPSLKLTVRYFQDSTPLDVPCREENFIRREISMALPIEKTALVLVDLWNIHFIQSWLERATAVLHAKVIPAMEAARRAGLTVVHAPSPPVAEQYPQLRRHKPAPAWIPPTWPPAEFRQREGQYTAFRGPRHQPPGIGAWWEPMEHKLGVSPAVTVLEDEYLVATGQQLHELAEEKGLLHLIYAGFATNWCIMNRDYGVREMGGRGYNVVLLRDATMGVEYPDTLHDLLATEMAIREVETQCGFSALTNSFLMACAAAAQAHEAGRA